MQEGGENRFALLIAVGASQHVILLLRVRTTVVAWCGLRGQAPKLPLTSCLEALEAGAVNRPLTVVTTHSHKRMG